MKDRLLTSQILKIWPRKNFFTWYKNDITGKLKSRSPISCHCPNHNERQRHSRSFPLKGFHIPWACPFGPGYTLLRLAALRGIRCYPSRSFKY